MAETKRRARGVRLARMILIQAIRDAMVNDLVVRNVADLAAVRTGKPGRPSGLGRDWTPRELRHAFVSLLSDSGVPIEQIADTVGRSSTRTTEVVHRHQLRPVTRPVAIALGPLFES